MEIELQKQDYEVKKSFTVPAFLQKFIKFINYYGNLYTISLLCLLGYFGLSLLLGSQGGPFLWGAMLSKTEHVEFFRLVTSMFLHGGFLHFAVNMLSLFAIAKQLQLIWTKPQIFIVFFLSGFLANYAGYYAYNYLGQNIIAVGASGGLFGLLGAMTGFFLFHPGLNNAQRSIYIRQLFPILFLNILIGLFVPQIAFMVHVFGFLAGIVLGAILEKLPYNFTHHRSFFWALLWLICIIFILVSIALATQNYKILTANLPVY